jgi:hypothetical protein
MEYCNNGEEGGAAWAGARRETGGRPHLSNNAGKGQLAQEQLRGLLKVPNFPKRAHAGAGAAFFYRTSCLERQATRCAQTRRQKKNGKIKTTQQLAVTDAKSHMNLRAFSKLKKKNSAVDAKA